MTAARFFISGCVQGVAFRVYARAQATALGLCGHACNLDDGRVEVLAVGDADAIERFSKWLQHGPPLARVDGVKREAVDTGPDPQGFAIG